MVHEARFVRFGTGKAHLGVASHALQVLIETFGFACWHFPPDISAVSGKIRFHTLKVATTNQSLPIREQTSSGGWRKCRTAPLGFFPLVARFEEKDANLIAIDPGELTAPVRVSHSRKQQKKFLEGKTFDRAVDGQSSAGLRYILHSAGPPPSTVDGHHVGGKSPLKYDTLCLPEFHLNQTSS